MQRDDFEIPDLGKRPLLFGRPELVEGYYALERTERNMGMGALGQHGPQVHLWYECLTLHYRAYRAGFPIGGGSPEEVSARVLRSELLALSLTSSKAALDLLLAGYYSPAYAAIRHMIETVLTCHYVEAWPSKAKEFYSKEPGTARPPSPAKASSMVGRLKTRYSKDKGLYESVYKAWRNMSDGSHPSSIGIVQTRDYQSGMGVLGATYQPALFGDGVGPGLGISLSLLFEVRRLQPLDDQWNAQLDDLSTRLNRALTAP